VQKVLNQEEIDAMFRVASKQGVKPAAPSGKKVEPWNFRKVGQISREQLRAISTLHEAFARNLTHSLGAYLRVVFDANLVSVEQLTYREFLGRIPDLSYLASFHLTGAGTTGAVYLDLALAFPIIDVLLGGNGAPKGELRDVTEIEDNILAGVVALICRELETAWRPLGLTFEFEQRQPAAQMQRLMPPNEKTLSLSFEIRMPESQGTLNVAFPAAVSNALLRKLSDEWGERHARGESKADQIRPRLLGCDFETELCLPEIPVDASALLALAPGSILRLKQRVDEPPTFSVAGKQMYTAAAVRSGSLCAAKILHALKAENDFKEYNNDSHRI
jgi:flagellar motor switch protein FliM